MTSLHLHFTCYNKLFSYHFFNQLQITRHAIYFLHLWIQHIHHYPHLLPSSINHHTLHSYTRPHDNVYTSVHSLRLLTFWNHFASNTVSTFSFFPTQYYHFIFILTCIQYVLHSHHFFLIFYFPTMPFFFSFFYFFVLGVFSRHFSFSIFFSFFLRYEHVVPRPASRLETCFPVMLGTWRYHDLCFSLNIVWDLVLVANFLHSPWPWYFRIHAPGFCNSMVLFSLFSFFNH